MDVMSRHWLRRRREQEAASIHVRGPRTAAEPAILNIFDICEKLLYSVFNLDNINVSIFCRS
jgi:hypothetical protein